MENLKGPELG